MRLLFTTLAVIGVLAAGYIGYVVWLEVTWK